MICPNCGSFWPDEDRFCSDCGAPLHAEAPAPAGKGRRWVPVLLMAVMLVLGTAAYFAIRLHGSNAPASVEAPWFAMEGNTLVRFDPEAYTGSSDLVVPATIDGVEVLGIGVDCFYDCDGLTSVTLPEGLATIGDYAFAECDKLRGMRFPESVTSIGSCAFYNCADLEAVCIYNGVQSIGSGAFAQCGTLSYILYNGTIGQWDSLYGEYINPFAYVYCGEGVYAHGGTTE